MIETWKRSQPVAEVTKSSGEKTTVLSFGYKAIFISGFYRPGECPVSANGFSLTSGERFIDFNNVSKIVVIDGSRLQVVLKNGTSRQGWPTTPDLGRYLEVFVGYLDEQDGNGYFRPFSVPVRDTREVVFR